jgi:hypothetical protein
MPRIQGRPPHWLGLTVILSIIIHRVYSIPAIAETQAVQLMTKPKVESTKPANQTLKRITNQTLKS